MLSSRRNERSSSYSHILVNISTGSTNKDLALPYPDIWMVQERQSRAEQLPNAHLLEKTKFA